MCRVLDNSGAFTLAPSLSLSLSLALALSLRHSPSAAMAYRAERLVTFCIRRCIADELVVGDIAVLDLLPAHRVVRGDFESTSERHRTDLF